MNGASELAGGSCLKRQFFIRNSRSVGREGGETSDGRRYRAANQGTLKENKETNGGDVLTRGGCGDFKRTAEQGHKNSLEIAEEQEVNRAEGIARGDSVSPGVVNDGADVLDALEAQLIHH